MIGNPSLNKVMNSLIQKDNIPDSKRVLLSLFPIPPLKPILSALIVLSFWWTLGFSYLNRTLGGQQHDIMAHVDYSMWLSKTGKFPNPRDGGEKFHPPGFYLFSQLFFPSRPDTHNHIQNVRIANFIIFGTLFAISIIVITGSLERSLKRITNPDNQYNPIVSVGSILSIWVLSTPALINLFTSYNNDAMSCGLVSLAVIGVIKFLENKDKLWENWFWIACILIGGCGAVHTKYSTGAILTVLIALVFYLAISSKIDFKKAFISIPILILCGLSLLPWAINHNYYYTKELLPSGYEKGDTEWMDYANMNRYGGYWKFILSPPFPPFSDSANWETPFVYNNEKYPGENYWTKKNLTSSLIVTGLFGEWDHIEHAKAQFKNDPKNYPLGADSNIAQLYINILVTIAWTCLISHIALILWNFRIKKQYSYECLTIELLLYIFIALILSQLPFANAANSRYFPLLWAAPTMLVMFGIYNDKMSWKRYVSYILITIGIVTKTSFTMMMNRGINP